MKIDNSGAPIIPITSTDARTGRTSSAPDDRKDGPSPPDQVQGSAIALSLQPDTARLERLREAVRTGAYSVPAAEISKRLVDEHLDNSSKRS